MSKRIVNQFNALLLSALTVGMVLLVSSVGFSADTYTIPETAAVTLAWDPNGPTPDGYHIYQRIEGQSYDYTQPCWTGPGTSGTVYNLDWDTTYYFVVRGYTETQESADSQEVSYVTPSPEPATYSITASAGANGTITPPGVSSVDQGGSQPYTITPDAGYHVSDVQVDGVSIGAVSSYTFSQVTADHTIDVSFAIDSYTTYTITASAGANGNITPPGVSSVDQGGSQPYSITPDAGYHVSDVKVDGVSIGTVSSYTFSQITANHTISASFAIDSYTITASAGANGTITPPGVSSVDQGGSQPFTITPDAGYHVSDVKVDGVSIGAVSSYTFSQITANHTISATFEADTFTITATAGANGTITPAGSVDVTYGQSQAFSFTADPGFHISDVIVDGQSMGAMENYTFPNLTSDQTLTVSFSENTLVKIWIEAEDGDLQLPMEIAGDENAGADGFIWVPSGTGNFSSPSENSGYAEYHFDVPESGDYIIWGRQISNDTASDSFFVSVDGQTEIAWHTNLGGQEIWTWDVVSIRNFGDPRDPDNPELFWLAAGSHTLKISQREDGTKLDRILITNQTDLTDPEPDGDGVIESYSILATAGDHGSISPENTVVVPKDADQTFTIIADTGYHVVDVIADGLSKGALSSYTFSQVTADHAIDVSFAIDSYTISASAGANGTITPPGVSNVDQDGTQPYTIAPDAGYHVSDVKVDGVSIGAVPSYTFSQITANHTINATFEADTEADTFTITATAGVNGTITPTGSVDVTDGQSQSFSFTADPGFHISDVIVDGQSMGAINTYTFDQITSDRTIHAIFTADEVADTAILEAMEFGDVQIDHTWTRVNFEKTFVNPVVVAGPIGLNSGDPSVIRIQNVDTEGFEIRLQEWDYLDGYHITETVSYLVMEQGNYILDDGTKIEAGSIVATAAASVQKISFNDSFNVAPVVMTTVTSFNDSDALTGRIRRITVDFFQYRMQEQESNAQNHGAERLSYIAWEPSSGAVGDVTYLIEKTVNSVTQDDYCIFFEDPFASAPTFLADMQTTDGGDTANVRYANKDGFAVDVLIDEEQSRDTETGHTTEVVGYMAFSRNQTGMSEAMEFGDVQIDHTWTRVNFEKTFVNPVVVAGPIGLNSDDPSVIRIQNVDTEGFEMRIQKWDYLDGSSIAETVSYLVLEQGNYILDDGTKIEAGSIVTTAAASFKKIIFNDPFNVAPVVMTTVTSFNDSDALTGRIRRITVDGFKYRMQEQQSNVQNHGAERLSYIAWEPSSGAVGDVTYLIEKTANAVRHNDYCIFFDESFASAPTFLADMQTFDSSDTANVRYANKDGFAVDVLIDEEQSRDTEIRHPTEVVGYMAFSR